MYAPQMSNMQKFKWTQKHYKSAMSQFQKKNSTAGKTLRKSAWPFSDYFLGYIKWWKVGFGCTSSVDES